jgi:hypothetical protein
VHRALDPSEATQSVLAQQAQQEAFKHVLVCAQDTVAHFGEPTWVDVIDEYGEHDREPRTWVCGDPEEVDEEDDQERDFRVRPGPTGDGPVRKVCVIGTLRAGTKIPCGQPIAIRRSPTEAEQRSAELLQEAIKEGELGLKQYEEQKSARVQQNRIHQCFTRTQ